MSRKLYVSAALAALALCALSSCVKEVLVEDKPAPGKEGQTWTVTMEATKAEKDPETKALLLSDDEKEIDFHWAGTDEVQVYYEIIGYYGIIGYSEYRGTLVPEQTGSTTTQLRGTLSGDFVVGETYTLYFLKKPAAQNAYAGQKGTVEDIANNFDYATATVEVKEVDTVNNTVVFSHAAFESQQSITKFIFSGTPGNIVKLTVTAAGRMDPVTVIPDTPAKEFHAALPKVDSGGNKIVYTFLAEAQDGNIYEGTKKAALQAGKYYKATVTLFKYDPIATPLTIEALEDGVITISNPLGKKIWYNDQGGDLSQLAQVTTSTADPIEIPVSAGQRVVLGGNNTAYAKATLNGGTYTSTSTNIRCSARHYLYGNVMSLKDVQSYANPNVHAHIREIGNYAFYQLFHGTEENPNSTLLNHPVKSIELPATTVGRGAYGAMFAYCTSLETAPELPATSFAGDIVFEQNDGPYNSMFADCHSLKKAPSRLPAKTIPYCYHQMFQSCWSLEASPILEDENPANRAYNFMFAYCGNLKQITCYSRNNLWGNNRAPYNWVKGVSSTGVFIKHPNADWEVGNFGIPSGWTNYVDPLTLEAAGDGTLTINNPRNLSITYSKDASMAMGTTTSLATISIPVSAGDKVRLWGNNAVYSGYDNGLYDESMNTTISGSAPHYVYGDIRSLVSSGNYPNETSLSAYAFAGLFKGNTKLRSHEYLTLSMGAATLGERAFTEMFAGCTALVRAPELPATSLAEGCYEGMFANCTALTEAPALEATTLAQACYSGIFRGCTALVTAPALPATTLAEGCYMNMFDNCTSLKESPELKAQTLATFCYAFMFRGCTSLKKITCTASNLSAENALMDWVDGVPTGSGGIFIKKSGIDWPSGISGIPTGWTVQQSD